MDIDFSNVPDTNGTKKPLPPGDYFCRVDKVKDGTSKQGNRKWDITFKVMEGQHKGRLVWDTLTFSENALWRVKVALKRLGFDVSGKVSIHPHELEGREAILALIVDHSMYQGQPQSRNKVKAYVDPSPSQEGGPAEGEVPF